MDNQKLVLKTTNNCKVNSVSVCPICLSNIEDVTTALNCRHRFCFGCISQWSVEHNRCPVCRQTLAFLEHQCYDSAGQQQTVRTPVNARNVNTEPQILQLGDFTLIETALESPLFILQPVIFPFLDTVRYSMQMLDADHIYFVRTARPGTLYTRPENLFEVVSVLEQAGITRYDPDSHLFSSSNHPGFMQTHKHHAKDQVGKSNGNPSEEDIFMGEL